MAELLPRGVSVVRLTYEHGEGTVPFPSASYARCAVAPDSGAQLCVIHVLGSRSKGTAYGFRCFRNQDEPCLIFKQIDWT